MLLELAPTRYLNLNQVQGLGRLPMGQQEAGALLRGLKGLSSDIVVLSPQSAPCPHSQCFLLGGTH